MPQPVRQTVQFKVSVRSYNRGDCWVAKTRETGIFTYGESREEAEALNGEANVILIQSMKEEGMRALRQFLADRGISHDLDGASIEASEGRSFRWEDLEERELARAA